MICSIPENIRAQSSLYSIDSTLFRSINKHHFGPIHRVVSRHDDIVMPLGILAPAIIGASGYVQEDHYRMDSGILSLLSTGVTYGVTKAIKHSIKRERPFLRLYGVRVSNLWSADPYSFPSGHTSMAFSLATSLSLRYPSFGTIIPLYMWAGFVGYSRVYLGLHYPSDVLVGAIVGMTVAVLVTQLDSFIEGRRRELLEVSEPVIPSALQIPIMIGISGFGLGAIHIDGSFHLRLQRSF